MNYTTIAFVISSIAGLSTLIGAIVILIKKKNINNFILKTMAFSAGVMLSLSILDLLPESMKFLSTNFYKTPAILISLIFLSVGVLISIFIDKKVPTDNNNNLYKVGFVSMIAMIIHNIPEGIATFITTNNDITLGISLAIAIALHNIPEGISIALPIYYSTNKKKKAIFYTLISGISEPFGAILAFLFLKPSNIILGIIFGLISGIMIHISCYELMPSSLKYKNYQSSILYFIIGSIFVIINLIIFN